VNIGLSKDISERNDPADIMPEKVEELDQRMADYLNEIDAQMPRVNPNFDPDKPLTPDERQRGRGDADRNRKGWRTTRQQAQRLKWMCPMRPNEHVTNPAEE